MLLYLPASSLGKPPLALLDQIFHLRISEEPNVRWSVLEPHESIFRLRSGRRWIKYLGVHLRAHDLPDVLFLDLTAVRFLENDPRPDDFAESGVGD